MVQLFFKVKTLLPNMAVLFESEVLSQEWQVVIICGEYVLHSTLIRLQLEIW